MNLKEERLKELKEIRRGIGILFLAILTFTGNLFNKYIENFENEEIKNSLIMLFLSLLFLFLGLILISIPIWRILRNGRSN